MFTPNSEKKNPNTIEITLRPLKKGHQPHLGGAGVHQDRRLRRTRTRAKAFEKALDTK